ncbi:MAG TPA: sortase, partial [Anaerolineaceae bacterium]|nr:sortase [Anaerolineaceae bacterium]
KDISGITLFLIGIILIGISVFNLFEDPITSYYYRMRRNLTNNSMPPPVISTRTTNAVNILPTMTPEVVIVEGTQAVVDEFEIFDDEGFVPFSVEVTEVLDVTPEPTHEYDVVPVLLSIPSIELEADSINAQNKEIVQGEKTYIQWLAPDEYAIGWHFDSAFLGKTGNTILNGHHNVYGKVFENLDKLVSGDVIYIVGNDFFEYEYVVSNTMILPERDVSFEERLENARWILPSEDERVTLITCWPYFSNTHRLIIVARPIGSKPIPITNDRE